MQKSVNVRNAREPTKIVQCAKWQDFKIFKICKQESLANANVNARQQCMYEGRYRRNLSSVENPTVEANIMSLSCMQPMLFYPHLVSW